MLSIIAALLAVCILSLLILTCVRRARNRQTLKWQSKQFNALKPNNGHTPASYFTLNVQSISTPNLDEFTVRVEELHNENDREFAFEYDSIPEYFEDMASDESKKSHNFLKNRYKNIFPYDHNRIVLVNWSPTALPNEKTNTSSTAHDDTNDYINASYIGGYCNLKEYIATQAPLYNTVQDFWLMVWQENCYQIIMACNLTENGRSKCQIYFPSEEGGTEEIGEFKIITTKLIRTPYYTLRNLQVQKKVLSMAPGSLDSLNRNIISNQYTSNSIEHYKLENAVRQILHYQYTAWPDFGAPQIAAPLLNLVRKVRATVQPEDGPLLIHCSAGVGRTGTFILLDIMLQKMVLEGKVEVRKTVTSLRKQRGYMVQSLAQYIFIHDALVEAYKYGTTLIPSIDIEAKLIELYNAPELVKMQINKLKDASKQFLPSQIATNNHNLCKNRDPELIPYQRSLVPLLRFEPEKNSFEISYKEDYYINANFIKGYWLENNFIVTQTPMEHTCVDFWSAILQENSKCVVMLCENTADNSKTTNDEASSSVPSLQFESSEWYFPAEEGTEVKYGFLTVKCVEKAIRKDISAVERKLVISWEHESQQHLVRHYLFKFSPAKLTYIKNNLAITDSNSSLTHFVGLINEIRRMYRTQAAISSASQFINTSPIIVHDRLGTTWSGIFCSIFIGIDSMHFEDAVDVFQTCRAVSSQRPFTIPSTAEYCLIFKCLMYFQTEHRQI